MSGECDKCTEHALECICNVKTNADISKRNLRIAKLAYKEITAAIKQIEDRYQCIIPWDEFISVNEEGFGFFDLTAKDE